MPLRTPRVMAAVSREPRYEGEDVSPTTSRELRGFYTYGIGAEVFAVCGVGEFLASRKLVTSLRHDRVLSPGHFGTVG